MSYLDDLTKEQVEILNGLKKERFEQKDDVHQKIMPLIAGDVGQIRELTQNIAIIAGAIAAFTIPIINSDLIKTKSFAFIALLLLFSTILYAVFHLSEAIPNELNDLVHQHTVFLDVLQTDIDRINTVLETGNTDKPCSKDLYEKLKSLEKPSQKDYSLNILRILMLFALVSILLSFIDFHALSEYLLIRLNS